MKHVVACFLAGLSLAVLAGSASAQPVKYWAELLYVKVVDGPRPAKTIVVPMRAVSAQAAESMCGSYMNMIRLSRNILHRDPNALGLTGNWYASGGKCVTDKDGKIKMTVEASSGGNN